MPDRPRKRPRPNPFYVLLLVASTAFVITSLAYLMVPYVARQANERPAGRAPGEASRNLAEWLDRRGPEVLAAEFGAMLVLGVLACFTFQVVYNIMMSCGIVPVKGLTLPLLSYGGSSMIATLAGFGLILNVRMRRFTN